MKDPVGICPGAATHDPPAATKAGSAYTRHGNGDGGRGGGRVGG
jgi:hypothetical protein